MDDYLIIAIVLMALGAGLLGAEILVPTGGFLIVGALVFFALAVGIILYQGTTIEAVVAIGGLAVGLPAAGFVAVAAWRRMSLDNVLDEVSTDSPIGVAPEANTLKGRAGKTVSPLRPSGSVEFDGKRVDAMTEGMMLDAGVWVRCVDVKRGQVIVRAMESQPDVSEVERADAALPAQSKASAAVSEEPQKDEPKKEDPKRPRDDFDDFDIGLDKI